MRLLIVEDEELLRGAVVDAFLREGWTVDSCGSAEEGLRSVATSEYELIILDLGLPGMHGFQFVKVLREDGNPTPLIILTSQTDEESAVRGLSLGADHYIRKPFSMSELKAYARALLRKSTLQEDPVLTFGRLEMDLLRRTVRQEGRSLHLTGLEFKLLASLVVRQGDPAPREELTREVWGIDFDPTTKVLDVHLSNLRKKLREAGGPHIELLRNQGHRLTHPDSDS